MPAFRTLLAGDTAASIKGSRGRLGFINLVNRHSAVIYVKFYDKATAATGSDTPKLTIPLAATSGHFQKKIESDFFQNGIQVRSVTENTDSGTTSPGTLPIIEGDYY